jgi:hypothetical protein
MAKAVQKANDVSTPIVQLYMAEDFRQEVNGKVSAVGLYPDRTIVFGVPAGGPEPTKEAPMFIKSLGFLLNISNLLSEVEISIDIVGDGGITPFLTSHRYGPVVPGRSINLIGIMEPCAVTSLGKKVLSVSLGNSKYSFDFEFRRDPEIAQPPMAAAKKTVKRATRASSNKTMVRK